MPKEAPPCQEEATTMRSTKLVDALTLYVLTDPVVAARTRRDHLEAIRAVLGGGASAVQLRAKPLTTDALWEMGRRLRTLTRSAGVPFIVNDRVDLALALDADGVHLGEEDLPVAAARRLANAVGRHDFIIGFSTAIPQRAEQAVHDGADYISVGNLFGTQTKPDAGAPIGLGPLTEIARDVPVPVIGIGGVTLENAAAVIDAGGAGVAVVSALIAADDPTQTAAAFRRTIERARQRPPRPRTGDDSFTPAKGAE